MVSSVVLFQSFIIQSLQDWPTSLVADGSYHCRCWNCESPFDVTAIVYMMSKPPPDNEPVLLLPGHLAPPGGRRLSWLPGLHLWSLRGPSGKDEQASGDNYQFEANDPLRGVLLSIQLNMALMIANTRL